MTDVKIIRCTGLYRRYEGQNEPQNAYIELDLRESSLLADYEVGTSIPFTVYYGFERRYPIPVLTDAAANRVMEEITPMAARVLADWEEIWDGNNMVARLGEAAQAAEAEIQEHLGLFLNHGDHGKDVVTEWDIDGATNGSEVTEYGITAETSDERLREIAAEITRDLAETAEIPVLVVHGLDEYLRSLRADLTEQSA